MSCRVTIRILLAPFEGAYFLRFLQGQDPGIGQFELIAWPFEIRRGVDLRPT
jgi:hypothetical protein